MIIELQRAKMSYQLKKTEPIYGQNPEFEVWNYYVTKLTNIHFVKNIVNKKVSNTVISKIVNSGMQARELYEAQKQASLLSKPILLLYAFERLALMLILTQNPQYESKEKHGVEHNGDKVIVRGEGLFADFHNCYSHDPSNMSKRVFV